MHLWRISNHATLDGRGGLTTSARWHSEGRSIVYLAETPAGALIESLVHLELNPARFPKTYGLLKAEASDELPRETINQSDLPKTWLHDPVVTRTAGDEWLANKNTALLRVPSSIVPETFNVLLNPEHRDGNRVRVLWHQRYPWDARLM